MGEEDTPILDSIKSPSDLAKLSISELEKLSKELRYDLITRVNKVGGHFASSLGVTELTVALHYSFKTPVDKIVWDVGHQAYIHKILTGRREQMAKVRTLGGISGFPKRDESPYDTFGVAHAGTSISAALGMLEGSKINNIKNHSVAVIGDGAMTAGMAFEALNHTGHLHKNLIVILNDNEMSIAPNVGALSLAFSQAITGKLSNVARRHFKSLTEKGLIPKPFYRFIDKAEEATQGFLSTPAMLFGSFGFRYLGPVDGHNISQLIDTFERAKEQDGPVLIHVLTTKGKGYTPAEIDPVKYHAISANQLSNIPGVNILGANTPGANIPGDEKAKTVITYTKVFGDSLLEICKLNSKVVGITAAMPDGTGLSILSEKMPERFYDVGIAEQHAVTFAAGLCCEGVRPVCAIYSTFLQRAYDQVVHDVCIQNLPVVFVLDRAGLVGSDGPTHHGVFDISYLRSLPNMTIMCPSDEEELRNMIYTAVEHTEGPTAIRYPRGQINNSSNVKIDLTKKFSLVEIGKSKIIEGSDIGKVCILSLGTTKYLSVKVRELLEKEDIKTTVIDPRFVKPIDEELLDLVSKNFDLIVTVEDHVLMGGFGSAVIEYLADKNSLPKGGVLRMGIPDKFIEHGTQQELYNEIGLSVEGIYSSIKNKIS